MFGMIFASDTGQVVGDEIVLVSAISQRTPETNRRHDHFYIIR